MNDTIENLRQWVGRTEVLEDIATAQPVAAMIATLDRRDALPREGDAIPEGWHWLYFLEMVPTADLAHDGHIKRGGFLPPVTLPLACGQVAGSNSNARSGSASACAANQKFFRST